MITNLKRNVFVILSLPNEGFPWVWVHLIRTRQCSIFQLYFEDVQWTWEVARSQRKAPWKVVIGTKIWEHMIYQGFSVRRKDLHEERGMTQWRLMQGHHMREKLKVFTLSQMKSNLHKLQHTKLIPYWGKGSRNLSPLLVSPWLWVSLGWAKPLRCSNFYFAKGSFTKKRESLSQ